MPGNVFPMSKVLLHLGLVTLEHLPKIKFQEDVPYTLHGTVTGMVLQRR